MMTTMMWRVDNGHRGSACPLRIYCYTDETDTYCRCEEAPLGVIQYPVAGETAGRANERSASKGGCEYVVHRCCIAGITGARSWPCAYDLS
jgi:hypothetical protein